MKYDCGTMVPLLEIKNLRASAGGKGILRGVDLLVNAGEVHFIMGPNGSGKTTLAHALMGHPSVSVDEGAMVFCGEDVRAMKPEERARKGLYLGLQYPAEVSGVGVISFLRTALAARGEALPRAEEFRATLEPIARRVGMSADLLDRNLNEGFSGGEKKRSEILQMHVLKPTLAILDEFDSGLDVDGVRSVAESLNDWMNPVRNHPDGRDAVSPKVEWICNGMSAERALIVITHTGRVSEYVRPHAVHIMKDGVIVRRGGPGLVQEIERMGFESLA